MPPQPKPEYLWIVDWRRFQHYTGRHPIWIKNYVARLNDDEYLALSSHRRAILHGLWLAFAAAGCKLRVAAPTPARDRRVIVARSSRKTRVSVARIVFDTRALSARLALNVRTSDLEALNHAGFIEFVASNVLAERLQAASNPASKLLADTRARRERKEEDTLKVASSSTRTTTRPPADSAESSAAGSRNARKPAGGDPTGERRKRPIRRAVLAYVTNTGWAVPDLADDLRYEFPGITDKLIHEALQLQADIEARQ